MVNQKARLLRDRTLFFFSFSSIIFHISLLLQVITFFLPLLSSALTQSIEQSFLRSQYLYWENCHVSSPVITLFPIIRYTCVRYEFLFCLRIFLSFQFLDIPVCYNNSCLHGLFLYLRFLDILVMNTFSYLDRICFFNSDFSLCIPV